MNKKDIPWMEHDLKPNDRLDPHNPEEIVPVQYSGRLNSRRPYQTEFGLS